MALKRKLTKAEFEKLSDDLKKEYKEDGEEFTLDVEGDEDLGALKRAKQREAEAAKDFKAKLEAAEKRLAEVDSDTARKSGDIATLEKSWQSKLDSEKSEATKKIESYQNNLKKILVDGTAKSLAAKISKSPTIMLPHIKARLVADFEGDEAKLRVLDADGKVSALTVEDLEAEYIANKDFSSIIIGSKASGGATGKQQSNGGAVEQQNQPPVDLSTMSPKDLAARLESSKANNEE